MVSQQLPAAIYAALFHAKTSRQVVLLEVFAYLNVYIFIPFYTAYVHN